MSRNRYAVLLLVALALALWLAGRYVDRTTAALCSELQAACTLAETGRLPQARQAYDCIIARAADASGTLGLLVRRNALDRMNETMAVLPQYANPENQADLAVEAARVLAQIDQLEQCFTGTF